MTNEQTEVLMRVVLFLSGAWVAGHHFLASNALTKAPHKVKLLLMPATVICGIGMCHGAWFYGSGVAILWCAPAVVFMSTTEFMVWRAGAFISTAFAQQEEIKEARLRSFNRMKYDLMNQAEQLNVGHTDHAQQREKERQP